MSPGRAHGMPGNPTLLGMLAEFVVSTSFEQLPAPLVEKVQLIAFHNLLVALAGRAEAVPGQDRVTWPSLPAAEAATRLTDGRPAPIEMAIVANSLAMGARAQHDEHPGAVSHFGSTVIPPLLAIGELEGLDGRGLVTALALGYEVGARIAMATVGATAPRGFRPTSLYGPFASAAALGKALGMDAGTLVDALALAGNASCGLTQTWIAGTDEWRHQTAFAARDGFAAARLAGRGVKGAADTLEGTRGFFGAFAAGDVDAESLTAGLGRSWAVDDVLLKPYPICAFNQAPAQQLLELVAEHGLRPEDVSEIEVRLEPKDLAYPGIDTAAPAETRPAALMCLRTCLALALLHDGLPLESLEDTRRPEVGELWSRIHLTADADLESHTSCLKIVRTDGSCLDSGAPRGVHYDAVVADRLTIELQPLTGIAPAKLEALRGSFERLTEWESLDPLLDVVRSDVR